ncbi:MAG: hypothetical protein A2020_09300 [Lentisphaerae bacterium GWF2_45_14]|nr:MAG: hypothetical protein A2020_09300 [Lentisphaerae bacterium GWF2_45_14]
MKVERNYEFRKKLREVHVPARRNSDIRANANEINVQNSWSIVWDDKASRLIADTARDLQDYFFTSMDCSLMLEKKHKIKSALENIETSIVLCEKKDFPELGKNLSVPRSYVLKVTEKQIIICGNDERGIMAGCHYIEDLMNLKEAPILRKTRGEKREPLFSPRMMHSGWGIDQFPDAHLNAISHAGFDSILLFVKGLDKTTMGYSDFNDLIDRAASFGLDVYFYSYLNSWKHPDDADAGEYFDSVYGKLFKNCPDAKGICMCGESCEFPSKDPHTTGKKWNESVWHSIPDMRPSPGWWPCEDYPKWISAVAGSIRKYKPDADIMFSTYNWGWAPEKDRVKFLESMPKDITLHIPFEMFQTIKRGDATSVVMDYTMCRTGAGKYFESEAKAAHKLGFKIYTMSNTGGMTWDFGAAPYEPIPFRWMRRHEALHDAKKKYGLSGLMDAHHYGWALSSACELAKWSSWTNSEAPKEILEKIAVRDYGKSAASYALRAWKIWSDAMEDYVPSNEDQYGPFRCGPSYPLIFHPNITRTMQSKEIPFPTAPYAHFGGAIIKTFYHPYENIQQTAGPVRYAAEIKCLGRFLLNWKKGIAEFEKALEKAPSLKKPAAAKELGVGKFILATIETVINVKKWWFLNQKLMAESRRGAALKLLDQIERIALDEIKNAEASIPVVEADSRLGWEPSMEYVTDRWHLEWKIKQVRNVLKNEIPDYRKILKI